MNNVINLDTINDKQKIWLSQLSYLNINTTGKLKVLHGEPITVYELGNYLEDPNKPFNGEALSNVMGAVTNMTGEDKYPTQLDVVNALIECGLGDLKITDISKSKGLISNGFQALTFTDTYGNKGISYRGSDFDFSKGGIMDWLEADFIEYFKNDSTQVKEALEYYERNKSIEGNNYIYGHSLGGNLTSHVYLQKHDEIKEAFTINGNPINQKLLDTDEKVEAFNDPKKYNCNVICGDFVGHLKSCETYENNVRYIKNNGEMKPSLISAHMVQAATYDENGNLVRASEEEMKESMAGLQGAVLGLIQKIRETLNEVEENINSKFENMKEAFKEYKDSVINSFKNKINKFGYKQEEATKEEFQSLAQQTELEELEKIKAMLNYNQTQNYEEDEVKSR